MANVKGGLMAKRQAEVTQANNSKKGMQSLILAMKPQIAKALPAGLTGERFTRLLLTAISSNPQLAECTPKSFMGAMMQAAQLGLEPNTPLGQAYLIPYKNHGVQECQFQLGYKGMIKLFYNNGGKDVQAHEVCENDTFEYSYGLHPDVKHVPALKNRGKVILYYAVWHTKDGGEGFEVMSIEGIQAHMKKFSKAASKGFSPWNTNFDEMAKKTVIKKALKYAPMGTEFMRAIEADETVKHTDGDSAMDSLDLPDETEPVTIDAETVEEVPKNIDPETGEILQPKQEKAQEGQLSL